MKRTSNMNVSTSSLTLSASIFLPSCWASSNRSKNACLFFIPTNKKMWLATIYFNTFAVFNIMTNGQKYNSKYLSVDSVHLDTTMCYVLRICVCSKTALSKSSADRHLTRMPNKVWSSNKCFNRRSSLHHKLFSSLYI